MDPADEPLADLQPSPVTCADSGFTSAAVNLTCLDYNRYDGDRQQFDEETIFFYHVLWSVVTPVLFSLIVVIGTVGNLLVIYVILSRPIMQTATNYLLLNLAISDVAFLVICVPITAYKFAAVTYPFGDVMCKVIGYVMYVTTYVTVYTLVAVSFLRYLTVVCAMRALFMCVQRETLYSEMP